MKTEKQNIEELAKKIMILENECQKNHNLDENLSKIEEIIKTLSVEDMLAIDDYIMTKNLLTI